MEDIFVRCPECSSKKIVKNGFIHNGKQKYMCKKCRRQFVKYPENKTVSHQIKNIIEKLLNERISLAGICRSVGVSKRWLQCYVNKKYENMPKTLNVKKSRKSA
jgi:insertion element IS1 protein InsB